MEADSDSRRNRILDAAVRLFTRHGYDKTSVAEIAQEAGISKGAIYLHFESKDALFHALLRREMLRYAEDWHSRIEADPNGGTIGGIYRHILAAVKANPLIRAVFTQDRRILGKHVRSSAVGPGQARTIDLRAEFLRRMKEEGVVRSDIDAYSTAYLMSVFVVGIITMDEMMEPDAIPPFETLLSTMGSMMESYLSTDSPDASAKGKAILRQSMEQARTELTEER
jgi:TetR/AcrR family acrAB operon transcriptional repressor